MKDYLIRYATLKDVPAIKKFIDGNWKKNHILVRQNNLFEWQYTSDKLDYILGLDDNNNIQGMLGFISYSDDGERDIATSMWKANEGTGFLGVKLLLFLMNNEKHRTLFSTGINIKTTGVIYRRMNFGIGRMNQWFRLNPHKEYAIAKVQDRNIPTIKLKQLNNKILYEGFESFLNDFDHTMYVPKTVVPYKSLEYIKRRYFEHPSYKYFIYGIKENDITNMVIVLRLQEYKESRALRFVDCIGDYSLMGGITSILDEIISDFEAEYVDMYEKGLSENMLREAGWINLADTSNIIPNYFSPFEQCNVDVNYCTTDKSIVLFRGDGDQDRPN